MAGKTITRGEFHQLLGLHVIASRHLAALTEIENAAAAITEPGIAADGSLTSDYLWGSRTIESLFDALEIRVAD
jgi:hypothetical protein